MTFVVQRGDLRQRLDCQFYFPEHQITEKKISESGFHSYSIGNENISVKVVDGPFGSQLKVGDYKKQGIPLIRVSNCKDGYIDENKKMVYISEDKHVQLKRSEVLPGDVLLTKAGSLGYSAVYPEELIKGNITSHIAAIRPSKSIIPEYLALYLSSSIGISQIYRWGNKTTRPELNTDEVRNILVIKPPLPLQKKIVDQMKQATENRNLRLKEAENLLIELDEFIIHTAGIGEQQEINKTAFAIKLSQIEGPINPKRYLTLKMEKMIDGIHIKKVADILESKISPATAKPNEEWDLIRIDDLDNKPMNISIIRTVLGTDLKGSFFNVQENDVLVARLGPTILNQKIVICPRLSRKTVASPEFLVLRCRAGWSPLTIMWILRTAYYRDLIYSKCRGATPSRFRVNRDDFENLPFPNIDAETQKLIEGEIQGKLDQIKLLRFEAIREWEAAVTSFEAQLLGQAIGK